MPEFRSIETEAHTLRFEILKEARGMVNTRGHGTTGIDEFMKKTREVYHELLELLQIPKGNVEN